MGIFEKIFGGRREPPAAREATELFRLLNGYKPHFTSFGTTV